MPCTCGEVTCICFYVCVCRPQICFCQACIALRDPQQQAVIESPSKQSHGQYKCRPRKKSAQSDPSNEQMSSLVNDSLPGQSQMKQQPTCVSDRRKLTLGCTPSKKITKQSSNDDPYATIRKRLSQPPLRIDSHPVLRKRLSDTVSPSNYDPHATLKRQLSEPCKIPISGNLFSELPSSFSHKNPSSTDVSSLSSVSSNNPSLPSTSKTGSSPSTSGPNKDFKSRNLTTSRRNKVPTTPSDSYSSCANIEYIKEACDKALPSYESFCSRFATTSSDENNNRNFGLNISASRNQDARLTSTGIFGHCAERRIPLYPETSGASSVSSCNNPDLQSLHSSDRVHLQLFPQEHPLNLSLAIEDKHKTSFSHSLQLSSQSSSPVLPKQQRMDTMEFSNIPTSEVGDQTAASFRGGSSTFSSRPIFLSSDSTYQVCCPKTRSESTALTSRNSTYTSCIVQNPSQYTVITEQHESPMETEAFSKNFDQNLTNCPLSAPSTSGISPFPTSPFSQTSTPNIITYCSDQNDRRNFTSTPSGFHNLQENQNFETASVDLNIFSETPKDPFLKQEVFSTSHEQTSSDRQSVIVYQSSRLPSQSTSEISSCQATNPVNIPYQAQSPHVSTFPPSMNLSDVALLASRTCNETQITPQASACIQPTSSGLNMLPAFSIAPSIESIESHARSQEHLPHHSQSLTLQSASSGMPPQRTVRYRDDETGENNYTNRSKRRLS